jgi:TonB family protein
LGLAMLLALTMHVLVLLAAVPDRELRLPEVRGSGQVTVSIVRPALVTTAVSERAVEETTALERRQQGKNREDAAAGRVPESAAPQLVKPAMTKKIVRREPVIETGPTFGNDRQREAGSAQAVPVPTGENTDAFSPAPAEAVRQAAPLTAENRPPAYPLLARKRGWEGTVVLMVRVLEDGRVQSVKVHSSSSFKLLDEAALQAVRRWRFQPGTRGGRAAAMQVLVPVHFVLRDEEGSQ